MTTAAQEFTAAIPPPPAPPVQRPAQIICQYCAGVRKVRPRGPVPKYCSAKCGVAFRKEANKLKRKALDFEFAGNGVAEDAATIGSVGDSTLGESIDLRTPNEQDPKSLDQKLSEPSAVSAPFGDQSDDRETDKRRPAKRSKSDIALLRRSMREARPYRLRIGLLFVLSLLATPLALLVPVPLAIAVDSALGTKPLPSFLATFVPDSLERSSSGVLLLAAGLIVMIALLSAVQSLATAVLQSSTGEKLTLGFQSKLFQQVQRLSFSFHDMRGTADSVYRIQYDSLAIQRIAVETLIPVTTSMFTLFSMLYIIFRIDTQLAMVAVGVSPFLVLYTRIYRSRMRPRYKQVKRLESSALGVVQEVLTSFRVVKAFGREDEEKRRFLRQSSEGANARIGLTVGEGAFSLVVNVTTALGTGAVLYIGVSAVRAGSLSLGELLLVVSYIGQLYGPLKTLSNRSAGLQKQLASAERVFDLLDEVPEVAENPHGIAIRRATGCIEFRYVSFRYPGQPEVLENVSIVIPAGARVGITGRTGAGKTTLVSLLARFYEPSEGRILLDGVDLREYRLRDLRRQFTIVLQEPVLFSTSIAENVAYARPGATLDEIVAATTAAGAHEFVSALPDGYNTLVGERGMSLSGGERQRLSLARAFLFDAPILILDEPTSSVDVETENTIMEAMERLMIGRTTFMIAHRMTTLQRCDLMLAVEGGRVSASSNYWFGARAEVNNG